MEEFAIALPCLPGGAEKLREVAEACAGSRRDEFEDFHRRVGLTGERWFLQQTPQGELVIITLDGDAGGAMKQLGASDHPFDVWFREQVRQVHGVDFTQPMAGPLPEKVFEG